VSWSSLPLQLRPLSLFQRHPPQGNGEYGDKPYEGGRQQQPNFAWHPLAIGSVLRPALCLSVCLSVCLSICLSVCMRRASGCYRNCLSVLTQRIASCGQPCRPPGLWVYALVCLPAGRYLSARRSRMRACRMWCQQTKIAPDKLQNLLSDQFRFCN
jgi:hypothetical protein